MGDAVHAAIAQMFQRAQRILLVSHIRPDGDAVGSLVGLGLSLQTLGKDVQMTLADGVPISFRHLVGSNQVMRRPRGPVDLSVVLDCSDLQRAGGVFEPGEAPGLNIDHHITNLNFARVNLVLPEAVATSAILAEYMPRWNLPINEAVARALLTGLVSDTIGFRTPNVTPHTLRLAAMLIEHGANLADLYNRALVRRSFEAARYWGAGLQSLQREGRIVWGTLTLEDRSRVAYPGNDDADLVNMLATIDECDVCVLMIEQRDNKVKVSWRAQPGIDVSQIALQFGGGGHPAAAGAELSGELTEVRQRVLDATRTLIETSNGKNGKKST